MNHDFEKTWENWTDSWKLSSSDEKRAAFMLCLDEKCIYTDPLTMTTGWDDLLVYMLDFHQQVPGGYFDTSYFLAHHNQSMAKWCMKDSTGTVISKGTSHGKYNDVGKLVSMTGFYAVPEA